MISGINTDVKVGDVVYHVQTEDKGLKSRLLLSLVYDKGTILASKRVSYDDVLKGADFDEKKLADHLNRQHQLICAAVSSGRIEQLKAMTGKARADAAKSSPKPVEQEQAAVQGVASGTAAPTARNTRPETGIPQPPDPGKDEHQELLIEAFEILEDDDLILEPDAVAVVNELPQQPAPANNKISIEIVGETKFKGGDRKTLTVRVSRGSEGTEVAGAEIMIKVLGSSFRPVIFHSRSNSNGLAKVHLQLPKFDSGRAALLVRVIAAGEELELRRIVTPG